MKTCQKCKSKRILSVCGKTSDMCSIRFQGKDSYGYVPGGFNIDDGSGDYLEFDLCLDCGQVQGKWPVKKNPPK